MTLANEATAVVLFDGVCNLCNAAVNFVIDRDPAGHFRFAALQSDAGRALLARHHVTVAPGDPDTVVLVENGRVYTHSDAALHIARRLSGPARLLWAFVIVPRALRDTVYRFVARHRYAWFGVRASCRVPTADLALRFLE